MFSSKEAFLEFKRAQQVKKVQQKQVKQSGPMTLIKQGRYIYSAVPPCGTNGLGTCVGLAIQHGTSWFIAHIDCKNYRGEEISLFVKNRLDQIAPGNSSSVHVIGSMTDPSSIAIRNGIRDWAGALGITEHFFDGFQITEVGSFERLTHEVNNTDGDGEFSVP